MGLLQTRAKKSNAAPDQALNCGPRIWALDSPANLVTPQCQQPKHALKNPSQFGTHARFHMHGCQSNNAGHSRLAILPRVMRSDENTSTQLRVARRFREMCPESATVDLASSIWKEPRQRMPIAGLKVS